MKRLQIPLTTILQNKIDNYLSKGTKLAIEKGWKFDVRPNPIDERPKPRDRLFASQISKCGRFLWLERHIPSKLIETLPPEDILIPNKRTMQFGHIFEDYLVTILALGGAEGLRMSTKNC